MSKLCEFGNCKKRASYALTYGKPDKCKGHREDRKPQYAICMCGKARPTYNEPGETKAICCSACKTETMVDVKSKKCMCGKAQPTYNEPGETKAICCSACKTESMVDVMNKKCMCGKARPTYNEPGETKAICCSACKTETMGDVMNKKCMCGKAQPTYNEPGETKAICCSACKTESMVNVKNKKCKCGKAIATYNEPGETKAICCLACKTETMVDVKNKKCKSGHCDTLGNKKYKGYCTHCFQHLFPTDPLSFQIRSKTKEIAVRDFINANYEGFQHDLPIHYGGCDCSHRRRVDHRKLINGTMLAIETDENQHKFYNKNDQQDRYNDLFMAYSGKWIFIRFNPDKYIDKNGRRKNPMISTRLTELKVKIDKQILRIQNSENNDLIQVIFMYYDHY